MQPNNSSSSSDEIDLGRLLQLLRKILRKTFKGILRIFLFLKRNLIKLVALTVVGIGFGYLINMLVDDKLQTEVIVKPNFESKDYLYDVVEELGAKIIQKDTAFFQSIDVEMNKLGQFKIEIAPILDDKENEKSGDDIKYLEILQNYKDNDFVIDIVKSEILKKTGSTHRIVFTHTSPKEGEKYVNKILKYINSNPYFIELQQVSNQNATVRIEQNQGLIKQIDDLVLNFTSTLNNNQKTASQGMVLLEGESGLNVPSLLAFKNRLVKENEIKKIELIEQKLPISIVNLGKTHHVKKKLVYKNFVLIPLLLIGVFFLISFIAYLNRKSKELQ